MTTTLHRNAADSLLAELDLYTRAAKPAPDDAGEGEADKPLAEGDEPGGDEQDMDPEAFKQQVLDLVKEELGWDGEGGDPNASKDALEDALGDMFDADVEILFDGKDALTLHVEGEDPVPLTIDYLAELLEELAKQGSGGEEDAGEEDNSDNDSGDEADDTERGYEVIWQRGVVDKFKHMHADKGPGGGRFVSKGGGSGGAAKKAASKAGKAVSGKPGGDGKLPSGKPGKPGGGPRPADLAQRAKGRAGPRATGKAVGNTLSAGTGQRVRVSGNKDGTFNVGSGGKKKQVSAKKVAALTTAMWFAGAFALGFQAALGRGMSPTAAVAVGAGVGVATAGAHVIAILRENRKAKK